MNFLDLTLPTPEDNLACDEALLDSCEQGEIDCTLRVWEARSYFVVLGHSNRAHQEVHRQTCHDRRIPILRRCTGGGTVLQGPGCLNYSLILDSRSLPELANVTETNRYVMNRQRQIFARLTGAPVDVRGWTDLCLGDLKFSGNAQRRKRTHLLFHGSILLQFDLSLIEACLRLPPRQPDYRLNRAHLAFLTNLTLPTRDVTSALRAAWGAATVLDSVPFERIQQLSLAKYVAPQWNSKFP